MNQMYHKREFIVFKAGNGFILYNTKKRFAVGHSHLNSFNACISIIKLIEKRQKPKSKSKYFLISILRISKDAEYSNMIRHILSHIYDK